MSLLPLAAVELVNNSRQNVGSRRWRFCTARLVDRPLVTRRSSTFQSRRHMPRDLTIDVLASYASDLLADADQQQQKAADASARLTTYLESSTPTGLGQERRQCLDTFDRQLDDILA